MKQLRIAVAAALAATLTFSTISTAFADDEQIVLTLFSNLPDRKNGQGLIEQMAIDDYMAEHPNVEIRLEALDEEAYKTKFRTYARDGMPDIVSVWGQPSFLDDVIDAGVLAELDPADYEDYTFVPGSLDGFMKDGKLYGLPRNSDICGFYYNKKLFDDNGWEVPSTYDDLLTLAGEIRAAGYAPVAMDGIDGWPVVIFYDDLIERIVGEERTDILSEALLAGDFSDPVFSEAAELLRSAVEAGLFQDGFDSNDYGMAMNLFTSGEAAMFYMGSWESSMAVNEDIPEEIRDNVSVFMMPPIEGGAGTITDIMSWNGGGYSVSGTSEYRDEAVAFLNYMMSPDELSRYGWENSVGLSAQDQSVYATGEETSLQLDWLAILESATHISGTTLNDRGSSLFKATIESTIPALANGSLSTEEFLAGLDASSR